MSKNPEVSDLFLAAADVRWRPDYCRREQGQLLWAFPHSAIGQVRGRGMPGLTASPSEMRRLKFSLPTAASASGGDSRLLRCSSPDAWQASWGEYAVQFRQTQKFEIHKLGLAAWVREAEIVASGVPLAEFDEGKLRRRSTNCGG